MKASEAVAFDLVERIYAAGEEPRLWTVFLERLARAVHGSASAMLSDEIHAAQPKEAEEQRFNGVLARAYEEYWASRNGRTADGGRGREAGEVVTSETMTPSSDSGQRTLYDDLLRRLHVRHLLGATILRQDHQISWVSVLRPGREGAFGNEETALLQMLLPHLQRALGLHARLARQGCRCAAMEEALDGIPAGILLLDRGGRPLFVNRAARGILDSRDGLSLGPDGLAAATGETNRELQRLIAQAAGMDRRPDSRSAGAIAVARPSERRAFSVLVKPISAADSSSGRKRPSTVIFLIDPDRRVKADCDVLRSLFGLTPAESRVAVELMQGESVEETARDLDVSLNTTRTHMKHLFEKTDTHRHRELVRLLLCSSCCSCDSQTPRSTHHNPLPLRAL
jgi:DNA-binding CsgD family transcriptional regulator/PAS domain-containing protein